MKTTQNKFGDFESVIQQCQENIKQNEMQRQKDVEQEKQNVQSFAAELAADPKMKALFVETDSEIGLAKLIQQRTGVALY